MGFLKEFFPNSSRKSIAAFGHARHPLALRGIQVFVDEADPRKRSNWLNHLVKSAANSYHCVRGRFMAPGEFYIVSDLHGAKRICDTRVSIDSVLTCLDNGEDAAGIQRAFPILSLDQIKDAIAYIRARPREIAEHRELQAARWDAARAESEKHPDPVFAHLRKTRAEQIVKTSSGK
jgi:uncharacterized protein (DUF433 family)